MPIHVRVSNGSGCGGLLFLATLGLVGIALLVLFPILILVALALGVIGVPLLRWWMRRKIREAYGAEGFDPFDTWTRRSSTEGRLANVPWDDVTATNYYETVTQDERGEVHTVGHFEVETATQGKVLALNESMQGFHAMIKLANEQTPHIPYVWVHESDYRPGPGPEPLRRGAYLCVDREQL